MQIERRDSVLGGLGYDPFGMLLVGRNWDGGIGYRYGFNNMENDDEVVGNDNALDFGARIYDARLGRWLSIDPLTGTSPSYSPYVYTANNPILFIDPDGKKETIYLTILNKDGSKTIIKKVTLGKFYAQQKEVTSSIFGISTHSKTKVYDMYDSEVYATLDLTGESPIYTIEASKTVGEVIVEGASYPWMGRLQARQEAGEYGGTMYSASNGQGKETKFGDPDAIVNIDMLMEAAKLNKPEYSKKQIFTGSTYVEQLKPIEKYLSAAYKFSKGMQSLEGALKSLDVMIDNTFKKCDGECGMYSKNGVIVEDTAGVGITPGNTVRAPIIDFHNEK